MRKQVQFATESDLCASFIKHHESRGYVAYAESCGFDILLVVPDGCQFGVQAKKSLNVKVLDQLLPSSHCEEGPDYRIILVPDARGLHRLCDALGFIVSTPDWRGGFGDFFSHYREPPYYWNPTKRCKLPEYVPDVAAGASGPIQLTPWKVAALKVVAHLERNGAITRSEIKQIGCDPTRWCQHWLKPHNDHNGLYVIGERMPRFDQQHPRVYAEILGKAKFVEIAA